MRTLWLTLWMSGCFLLPDEEKDGKDTGTTGLVDADRDGATADVDCDDNDPLVRPDALEVCNGRDDDCDGLTDAQDDSLDPSALVEVFVDGDGDGFGDPARTEMACEAGPGQSALGTDCDDANADRNPGAVEVCNGLDDDCNTLIDAEDPAVDSSSFLTFYQDVDLDGFGVPSPTTQACSAPTGFAATSDDCDDRNAEVFPGAPEQCNGVDDDCDELPDDEDPDVDPGDQTTWHEDRDGDGFGDPTRTALACSAPAGFVRNDNDCDDDADEINPDATEVCNGLDDDCDDAIDLEDASLDMSTRLRLYDDADGDGYGAPGVFEAACVTRPGKVTNDQDCNDGNAAVNPDAREVCNGIDDDCDALTDGSDPSADLSTALDWYLDGDGDGFGDPDRTTEACSRPVGYVALDTDCDDADPSVSPAAREVCGGGDEDCDGLLGEADPSVDLSSELTWYRDGDGDGYGDDGVTRRDCDAPVGFVARGGDCADGDRARSPAASEVCDGLDNDCDLLIDDADPSTLGSTKGLYFRDGDGDGYGTSDETLAACVQPLGYADVAGDCDERNTGVNPGAVEVCDGLDNDCDLAVDQADTSLDLDSLRTFYADVDGDGWGDPESEIRACFLPAGAVADFNDCDDLDATVNPVAPEICDLQDNDCDRFVDADDPSLLGDLLLDLFVDGDGDGYGDEPAGAACFAGPGLADAGGDCADDDPDINPGATEVCNGFDDNCNGSFDDLDTFLDRTTQSTWYEDADGDGFGHPDVTLRSCAQPVGFSDNDLDCDDEEETAFPGGREVCSAGIDEDCDGLLDGADPSVDPRSVIPWYVDADFDTYGAPGTEVLACDNPGGRVAVAGDCDDRLPLVNPGQSERCDGFDNDCDSLVDDADPGVLTVGMVPYAPDADGDGFFSRLSAGFACAPPVGFGPLGNDCNDASRLINPAASEVCNGLDDDCDFATDDADTSLDRSTIPVWFDDRDGDGAPGTRTFTCATSPTGGPEGTDCDDADPTLAPGLDLCDGLNNDCDPTAWSGDVGVISWHPLVGSPQEVSDRMGRGGGVALVGSGTLEVCEGDYVGLVTLTGGSVEVRGPGSALANWSGGGRSATLQATDLASLTVSGVTLSDGCADEGANLRFSSPTGSLFLEDVVLEGGACAVNGGSLWFSGAALTGTDLVVRDSEASGLGGGLALWSGAIDLTGVEVSDNAAGDGGGLYLAPGATLAVVDGLFSSNDATATGGGLLLRGDTELDRVEIMSNLAREGAGVRVESADVGGSSVTLSQNRATAFGGGLSYFDGDLFLLGSTLTRNSATLGGGGVALDLLEGQEAFFISCNLGRGLDDNTPDDFFHLLTGVSSRFEFPPAVTCDELGCR